MATEQLGSDALFEPKVRRVTVEGENSNGVSLSRRKNDILILLLLIIQFAFNLVHMYNERDHYLLLLYRQDKMEERVNDLDRNAIRRTP